MGHGQCVEPYGAGEPICPCWRRWDVSAGDRRAPGWWRCCGSMPPAGSCRCRRCCRPPSGRRSSARWALPAQPRMLRELTEALDALTTERPLVLVLEDLHWSDRADAGLARLCRPASRSRPPLILGTYRPVEAIVQAHPLRTVLTELRQHGQCVELALDYLSEADGHGLPRPAVRGHPAGGRPGPRAASAHPRGIPCS